MLMQHLCQHHKGAGQFCGGGCPLHDAPEIGLIHVVASPGDHQHSVTGVLVAQHLRQFLQRFFPGLAFDVLEG